jgi:hypothetical protein
MAEEQKETTQAKSSGSSKKSEGKVGDGLLDPTTAAVDAQGRVVGELDEIVPAGVDLSESASDLTHTFGGTHSRHDSHDSGAAMVQGDPSEPQGPEDAFGPGQKRGDYRELVDQRVPHYEVLPEGPRLQNSLPDDIGDDPGKKGGVDTVSS